MPKESELRKLTEEQKATVLGWIDEGETLRAIVAMIEKAEPEGFGIRTNLGTLSRMVALWRSEQLLKARPEEAERARSLLKNEAESIAFQKATIAVLHQRLFESAMKSTDGREQRETLRMLLEYEIKIRKLELAEKKLEESKRQFEFNAARLALKHWHEFRDIDDAQGPDDEEKIWMARDVIFVGPNGEKSPVRNLGVPRTEVVHKASTEEAEQSFTDGVKIKPNPNSTRPADAGAARSESLECHPQISGAVGNDNSANDKAKPIQENAAAPGVARKKVADNGPGPGGLQPKGNGPADKTRRKN